MKWLSISEASGYIVFTLLGETHGQSETTVLYPVTLGWIE